MGVEMPIKLFNTELELIKDQKIGDICKRTRIFIFYVKDNALKCFGWKQEPH